MIQRTFIFLKGISYKKEKRLWSKGICSWQQFLNSNIKLKNKEQYDAMIRLAEKNLFLHNSKFFSKLLPLKDNWRLYNFFKSEAIFLDIETVGRKVVLVGIYDNFDYTPFVFGYNLNLNQLKQKILSAKLIVTFNGASFDIPRLSKMLSIDLTQIPIFDLRFSLLSFGISGSLKEIESKLGIMRDSSLKSVDVFYLWNNFIYNHQKEALERLIAYNFEDTYNLRLLAEKAYSLLEEKILKFS